MASQLTRPRPMKETLHSRHHSTVLPRLKQDGKPPESAHTFGRFSYSTPRKQQSTEEASTPNIGRGTETQPKTTMHSLTTTIYCRTTSIGCLANQATSVQTVWSFTTRCETPVRLHRHPTDLSPEDLWRNPVRSFSYLDNGNLD